MNKLVYCFFISFFCISFISCSDEYTICETPVSVTLNTGFYRNNAGIITNVQPAAFSVSVLNSSAVYTNANNLSSFSAPLTSSVDTTRFIISIEGGTPDTFKVAYSTQVQHISASCGDINTFTLSGIATTTHTVDSILVENTQVNTAQVQHLKLFY